MDKYSEMKGVAWKMSRGVGLGQPHPHAYFVRCASCLVPCPICRRWFENHASVGVDKIHGQTGNGMLCVTPLS